MKNFYKDPDAKLDYRRTWATWLAGEDGDGEDTITSSTWTVPDGITKESDTHADTHTTIWLSGGTAGVVYKLTNRVTTTEGRIDDASFTVTIRQR